MSKQFPDTIGKFKRYTKEPNAISYGAVYTRTVMMDVPYEKRRTLRVYLPEDFSFDKNYPVMYMSDVQNAVDRYSSAYGEWDIDEHMHELLLEGYPSFIVVGMDCPKNPMHRICEYTLPKFKRIKNDFEGDIYINSYGREYAEYLINKIMPEIRATFPIKTDRNSTAFGGSSMGGLISFDIVTEYKDVFGYSLSFSPACGLFDPHVYKKELDKRAFDTTQKIYLYCGGLDLEQILLPATKTLYSYLQNRGYSAENIALKIDLNETHNEAAWSKYFVEAVKFWLK